MITDFDPGRHDDVAVAPELAGLNLADKADGPGAAAMIAAGLGVFMMGLLTVLAEMSEGIGSFLGSFDMGLGVGSLAGKSTISVIVFLGSWLVLHLMWKDKDADLKKAFYIGLGLGVVGMIFMFPPFFTLFKG
jgi:hypothetical protein